MLKKLNLFTLICVTLFSLCSCSDDEENGIEIGSYGYLIVNGAKWDVGISAPTYSDAGYVFWSTEHIAGFELEDVMGRASVGDDVSAPIVLFSAENAIYNYESGNVEVVSVDNKHKTKTLKFNDYTVVYSGKFMDFMDDERRDDLVNRLVINGTVEFALYESYQDYN